MAENPIVITANMQNERNNLERWFDCAKQITDTGILIVDSGSTDGTIEYARKQGATVIIDDTFKREGGAAARNQLLKLSALHFPEAVWMLYLDGDEIFAPEDFHYLRVLRDYLNEEFDVILFPRIDWFDYEMTKSKNEYHTNPDPQGRMIRIDSNVVFVRRLHEIIHGAKNVYFNLNNPKIHHFNRAQPKEKRIYTGKLYAKLHRQDTEHGHEIGKHPQEDEFYALYEKEGL